MNRLVLIDGNSLFYRAYHALPPTLTNSLHEPVNAVYGFSNMLLKTILNLKPAYMAVAFDTKAPTFRHIEFAAYKATRIPPPPDLFPQLPKVKLVLAAFNIPVFEIDGFEADDVIATLANKALKQVSPVIDEVAIVTGDRDTLQLVNDKVKVYASAHKIGEMIVFDKAKVREKYGVNPHQMADFKALAGDASDNIAGVAGIGPKTAAKLLQDFGSLEQIYANLSQIPPKIREKLAQSKEAAFQAKSLITLDSNVPLGRFNLSYLKTRIDWTKVRAEFENLRFKSLISRIPVVA